MSIRVTFANGEVAEYVEGRDAVPWNGTAIVLREDLGDESPEQKRARLTAELGELDQAPPARTPVSGARTPVPGSRPDGGGLFPPVS
jgi:hypothetical protein